MPLTALAVSAELLRRWLSLWDPRVYLTEARLPMLWVDGTNDFAYPLDPLKRSYRLAGGPRWLCTRIRMPHGQGAGEKPEEIRVFADAVVSGETPLATITSQCREGQSVWRRLSRRCRTGCVSAASTRRSSNRFCLEIRGTPSFVAGCQITAL